MHWYWPPKAETLERLTIWSRTGGGEAGLAAMTSTDRLATQDVSDDASGVHPRDAEGDHYVRREPRVGEVPNGPG